MLHTMIAPRNLLRVWQAAKQTTPAVQATLAAATGSNSGPRFVSGLKQENLTNTSSSSAPQIKQVDGNRSTQDVFLDFKNEPVHTGYQSSIQETLPAAQPQGSSTPIKPLPGPNDKVFIDISGAPMMVVSKEASDVASVAAEAAAIGFLEQLKRRLPDWKDSTYIIIGGTVLLLVGAGGLILGGVAAFNGVCAGAAMVLEGSITMGMWDVIWYGSYLVGHTLTALYGAYKMYTGNNDRIVENALEEMKSQSKLNAQQLATQTQQIELQRFQIESQGQKIADLIRQDEVREEARVRRREAERVEQEAQRRLQDEAINAKFETLLRYMQKLTTHVDAVQQSCECAICKDAHVNAAVQDCGHTFCIGCITNPHIRKCPSCQGPISSIARIILPQAGIEVPKLHSSSQIAPTPVEVGYEAVELDADAEHFQGLERT